MPWIFSGEKSADLDSLDRVLAGARAVRVTAGGCLVYSVNPEDDVLNPDVRKHVRIMSEEVLVFETHPEALGDLRAALRVIGFNDVATMYPGDFALEFLGNDDEQISVVRIDAPNLADWPLWVGKAYLANPEALESWLVARAVDAPLLRNTERS